MNRPNAVQLLNGIIAQAVLLKGDLQKGLIGNTTFNLYQYMNEDLGVLNSYMERLMELAEKQHKERLKHNHIKK